MTTTRNRSEVKCKERRISESLQDCEDSSICTFTEQALIRGPGICPSAFPNPFKLLGGGRMGEESCFKAHSGVQLDDSPNHLCSHCDLVLTSDPSSGHQTRGSRRLTYSSSSEGHSSSVSSTSVTDVSATVTSSRTDNKMTATHEEERDPEGSPGCLPDDGSGVPAPASPSPAESGGVVYSGVGYSNMSGFNKPARTDVLFNRALLSNKDDSSAGTEEAGLPLSSPSRSLTTRPVGGRSMRVPIIHRSPSTSQAELSPDSVDHVSKDPDSEGKAVFLSAPETACKPPKKGKVKDEGGSSTKDRFKKFFEPLRRSQSALNGKEIPAYALFLRQDPSSPAGVRPCPHSSTAHTLSVPNQGNSEEDDIRLRLSSSSISGMGADGKQANKQKRSIGTEVKKFFTMKRAGGGEGPGLTGREGRGHDKVTLETLKSWASSIDNLLADKYGVQCFLEFLRSEFSEENLEFWIACSEYKSVQRTQQQMTALAQKIFAEFVVHQAPHEINIDAITRDLTYANMSEPSPTTFDAAQKRIQALMDKDSYPRFLVSDIYLQLLSDASAGTR